MFESLPRLHGGHFLLANTPARTLAAFALAMANCCA